MLIISLLFFAMLQQTRSQDIERTWHFGHYRVEASGEVAGSDGYRIFKDDVQVFSASPAGFDIISVSKGKQVDVNEPTVTDITGDGVPDLIIEEYPRTPGCCFSYEMFSLGSNFHQISRLTGFPTPLTFEDINHDSVYEIVGEDWAFLSQYASPTIIFGYRRGVYELATNLMRHAPPGIAKLTSQSRKFAASPVYAGSVIPSDAYRYMLDLVYSGNAQAAWQFLDLTWPKDKSGKKEFREQFLTDLSKSVFWPQIRSLNGPALGAAVR